MPAPQVVFTPSASITGRVDIVVVPFTLPPPDPNNPATVVTNSGPGAVSIGGPFGGPGTRTLQPNQSVLWAGLALAGAASVPAVAQSGASVTVMRGTVADLWLFPAPGVAVI